MPELPEVETIARELDQKLANKTIKDVEVRLGKVVALGPMTVPPKRQDQSDKVIKFVKLLRGQRIRSVSRRAKLLIFDFAPTLTRPSGTLSESPMRLRQIGVPLDLSPRQTRGEGKNVKMLVHLKMTGQFIYLQKNKHDKRIRVVNSKDAPELAMPCQYTHVIFTFSDGSKLFYNDLRQFGYLKLVNDEELGQVPEMAEFGPEPLDKSFSFAVFQEIIAKRPKLKIKQLLVDQTLIAGIGNIYSDEILFHAKVRPARKVSSIKNQEARQIFNQIKKVLRRGIAAHGSSVGDFIRTDGSWGSMGKHHFVYGRSGEKCKVCGSIIKSIKFGNRTSSYCPKCQS